MDPLLQVKDLRVYFRKKPLLYLPAMDIPTARIHGIIGESGSGKSLFLFSLMGLLAKGLIADGEAKFFVQGKPVDLLTLDTRAFRSIRAQQIGMVFQEPMTALNPRIRCGEQVEEVLRLHGAFGNTSQKKEVLEALSASGLEDPLRIYASYPHQISGGQRQRVMIAMATVLKPALVLADEPTTALDPETGNAVLSTLVQRCKQNKSSLILVSHDLQSIARHAESLSVLRNGECLVQGSTISVLEEKPIPYVQQLLDASNVSRKSQAITGPGTLHIHGVSKTYGKGKNKLPVLKNVEVKLAPGETLAIVGKSGSGKSTLAKVLTGLEKADTGEVLFHGVNLLGKKHTGVQMVFQDPYSSLNNEITCGGAVQEVFRIRKISSSEAKKRTLELFQMVGLSADYLTRYPHQLSGGQRQRVCIARALAAEPEILILDESVAALDPLVQKQVLLLLADIQDSKRLIYLFITHNPEIAAHFAHTLIRIENGIAVQNP